LSVTSYGGYGFADDTLGGVGDVALEGGHVHLVSSSDAVVYPEPCANAFAIGAGGEVRNIEGLESASDTIAGNRHDDEIFGLDRFDVRFVCNTDGAPTYIITLG